MALHRVLARSLAKPRPLVASRPNLSSPSHPLRLLSYSACRRQHPPPPLPPPPEYDYDPSLDHRFPARFVREIKLLYQQARHHIGTRPLVRAQRPPIETARLQRRRLLLASCVAALLLVGWFNLERAPVTGRWQLNMVSDHYFDAVLKSSAKKDQTPAVLQGTGAHIVPDSDPRVARVRRVVKCLLPVSGMGDRPWKVSVIESPRQKTVSAFVAPGTTMDIFVFSDLLDFVHSDDELAGVLGHEMAHTRAKHAGETRTAAEGGLLLGGAALLSTKLTPWSFPLKALGVLVALGIPFTLLCLLPLRRIEEAEADAIGLHWMAAAGYDPRHMVSFWERMRDKMPRSLPDWLQMHPSLPKRTQNMMELMPRAIDTREQSGCPRTKDYWDAFIDTSRLS